MKPEHKNCLLCDSSRLVALEKYSKDGLVQCVSCGFVFSKWIPSEAELIQHYGTYSRNDHISGITIKRYEELSRQFMPFRKTGRWLDVGCGNGHLLQTVAKDGWEVYGTEFTDNAVEICRNKGIKMHQGPLNPSNYAEGSFDVISSVEVIEHINNFHEELNHFSKLLRPGGVVYITTPNFNSLSRHLLGDKWTIIEYPEHLCYFTPSSLNKLLTQHGFRKKYLTTSGISISRISRAMQSEEPANAQDKEEALRQKAEHNPLFAFAKKSINTALNLSGTGEAMKAMYIRG